jgi:hypothetical protein
MFDEVLWNFDSHENENCALKSFSATDDDATADCQAFDKNKYTEKMMKIKKKKFSFQTKPTVIIEWIGIRMYHKYINMVWLSMTKLTSNLPANGVKISRLNIFYCFRPRHSSQPKTAKRTSKEFIIFVYRQSFLVLVFLSIFLARSQSHKFLAIFNHHRHHHHHQHRTINNNNSGKKKKRRESAKNCLDLNINVVNSVKQKFRKFIDLNAN